MLAGWSKIDLDPELLTAPERWSVVRAVIPQVFKSRYLLPGRLWLLARTPSWIVARRVQRTVHGWYRIPTSSAAEHVRLHFDIWPIEVGDHVRIERGRLTAVAYSTAAFSEIIFVQPDGELEPDSRSPEMTKAWARFAATRHQLYE
jgi:hypothetical protein